MRITESEMECLDESLAEESYLEFAKRLNLDEIKQNRAKEIDACRSWGGYRNAYDRMQ